MPFSKFRETQKNQKSRKQKPFPVNPRSKAGRRNQSIPQSKSTAEVGMVLLKQETPIIESFLQYQKKESLAPHATSDVCLICSDGAIPAHAIVLQAVSPFFNKMFLAQGDYYFGNRPVIIPDYSTNDVERLTQFIYTGRVNMPKSEVENFKSMLKVFEVHPWKLQLIPDKKEESVLCFVGDEGKSVNSSTSFEVLENNSRKHGREKGDEDYSPVVKKINLNKLEEGKLDKKNNKVVGPMNTLKSISPTKRSIIHKSKFTDSYNEMHVSSTDSSEGEIDDSIYKKNEWFVRESRRCQKCLKNYKTPSEASTCLADHNRIRCYLCFKVVRNTEKLFIHFELRHKRFGKQKALPCTYCNQIVPYKSVSCHVISVHLSGKQPIDCDVGKPQPLDHGGGSSEHPMDSQLPADASQVPGLSRIKASPSKSTGSDEKNDNGSSTSNLDDLNKTNSLKENEDDDEILKLRDLIQNISFQSICGQIRVFVIKIKRT